MDSSREVVSGWEILQSRDVHRTPRNTSLFSSSLPVQVKYAWSEYSGQSVDDGLPTYGKLHPEYNESLEEIEMSDVGGLLPDDEHELLAGVEDDFDLAWLPRQLEDLEDDLFSSGGGIEMDREPQESLSTAISKLNFSDSLSTHSICHYGVSNNVSVAAAGEHPYGEHPSRTLFVRNINSNVEDSELRSLFEQYGDIRSLYTACKHRGFVMISYYDIRHARNAMCALQSKSLRRRKLDIHFSIPKDNPSENEVNQGTLVVFNLDVSVSNDDLYRIFCAFGMVKEIRETPHKRHHRFIEFYDVRDAEAALKGLNKTEIAGKRIKLEPSRPGGARRSFMHKTSQDLEHDDAFPFRHIVGTPGAISPSGNWPYYCSSVDYCPSESHYLGSGSLSPGLASIIPSCISDPMKISPMVKDHRDLLHVNNSRLPGMGYQLSYSFPDQKLGFSPGQASSFGESNYFSSSFERLSSTSSGSISLTDHLSTSIGEGQNFLYSDQYKPNIGSNHLHHVGSAPSGVVSERQIGYEMKQFQIDLDKIRSCEDTRTTLMIKNIPNKYTSNMLIAAIDENFKGSYDFFYLPIDLKNKCNMGYAFINMISLSHVIFFYEAFNGKNWENFNSEKIASIAYARIQGKAELISYFQNSIPVYEDGHCRSIFFQPEEDQETNEVQLLNSNNNLSHDYIHHKIPPMNSFNAKKNDKINRMPVLF
ncbi:protein MEI2-like 5 isoform X2 [Impatiens glandulifera]|uniref:protein MEI2-like 5 isoform X2 n=1 Tax=Impatiens glandulifera TaxID=253017 RepID=UPI001FB10A88|nr:protein MEI2-like 5 isoform X2 [Impatiens glandulifera]